MKKTLVNKVIAAVLAGTMIFSLAACGDKPADTQPTQGATATQATATKAPDPTKAPDATATPAPTPIAITISLPSDEEHLEANELYDKLVAELNTYLNANITWQWQDQATYYDAEHLGLKLSTGDVADVLVVGKDASFLSAAEDGLFWDLAPYIDDYDNLATIPEATRQNASANGKLYGLPRSRTLARNGLGYRLDWLNNLGLKEPTTWDAYTKMLHEFTYGDPDQNGVDDTVGLGIDSWTGVWNIMMTWFGVPNEWGIDANGELIYKVMTPEYKTALKAFRELYEDGVINIGQEGIGGADYDFINVRAGKARDNILRTGLAGSGVQVLDDQRKVQTYFVDQGLYGATNEEGGLVYTLQGYVDTGLGALCYPTTGMNNLIAISTKNIKTEEQLRAVLNVLNKINDGVCLNLIEYGWEGETYDLNSDGYVRLWPATDDDGTVHEPVASAKYKNGFNQVIPYFTAEANARPVSTQVGGTPVTDLEQKLYAEDIQYCVPNYGASYTSYFYMAKGSDLDAIINDAQQAYIRCEIDEAALDAAIQQWWDAGGKTVTQEMNKYFKESKK
jgi:putative aldouronate transport system substrate-binding protein